MDFVMFTLSISLRVCFGLQKNRLIEYAHLITHSICFGWQITNKFYFTHSYLENRYKKSFDYHIIQLYTIKFI